MSVVKINDARSYRNTPIGTWNSIQLMAYLHFHSYVGPPGERKLSPGPIIAGQSTALAEPSLKGQ